MQQSIAATDFNPNLLNNPKNTNNFFTSFDIQEAILNLDMIMQHKAAAIQVSANIYIIQRTKEQITFETKKAYFNLTMTYKAVKVLEDALISSKAQNKLIDDRFKQGLINKSDLLNAEIQVKNIESQLSEAQSNIINASDYLSILMGVHIGTVYQVTEPTLPINSSTTQLQISQNRADYMAMSSFINASSLMSKSYKYKFLPRLNAFGSYYLNDKNMLGFGSNSYLAGVQLSWNLLNGGRTRGMIQAQNLLTNKLSIQLEDKKNQDQLELNKTLREIEDLKLKIERQNIIIEQAKEVYDLVNDRNKQGLSLTSDLLLAQTQLIQQKILLEQLITSNNILHVYMEFLTTSSN
jgi:outer membrane protein TolC